MNEARNMTRPLRVCSSTTILCLGVAMAFTLGGSSLRGVDQNAEGRPMPVFEVQPGWPQLPNDWVLGVVSSVAVDTQDRVWLLHRPESVESSLRQKAAPPVVVLDAEGRFVRAWGGPGTGFDWPETLHGISVDHKNNVWITGVTYIPTPKLISDDMLLKFSSEGKFLMQIGGKSVNKGNADNRNLNRPADSTVHAATNEVFVADGYGNRRVAVFDADTGRFKRMWGAFGNVPEDGPQGVGSAFPPPSPKPAPPLDTEGPGDSQFVNPVHAIKISNDARVYVADRGARRVQVFSVDGKYLTQVFINRAGPSRHSSAGLAFSADPAQRFLYVADYGNSRIAVLDRVSLEVLYQFGERSAEPGDFRSPHHIAVDSKGNLYTAEVSPGNRAQKFVFKGTSTTLPKNALASH
jgi:DNA-binding beta-propeller fold protein YncE